MKNKKIKRVRQYKDFKKKNNILKFLKKENHNRLLGEKKLRGEPVKFPKSRKYHKTS